MSFIEIILESVRLTPDKVILVLMTLERLAIIICIAFILTKLPFFKSFQKNYHNNFDKKLIINLILFFSIFGILGTVFGVVIDISNPDNVTYHIFTSRVYEQLKIDGLKVNKQSFWHAIQFSSTEAIINFRVMILTVAGLLGGPVVGVVSGLIVGFQRYSLSGISAMVYMASSASVGLFAGLIYYLLTPKQRHSPWVVMSVCFLMELVRRSYLINFASNGQGYTLMNLITLSMIIGNTLGGYVFMKVIEIVNKERLYIEEQVKRQHEEIKSLLLYMVPHFLNSSLTDIAYKASSSPDSAKKIIHALANFTRKNLKNINAWSEGKDLRIADEIEQIKDYIFIMKEQIPELNFSENFDDNLLHFKCSLFVLQPLVENAITHGVRHKKIDSMISISISDKGDEICLSVEDNGIGMPEDVRQKLGSQAITTCIQDKSTGQAFLNVIQRLKKIFNNKVEFTIVSEQDKGTLITLLIPKEEVDYDE